ncbi:MFS transporter [Pseudoflavonifractor phocaeensis]|uniref:MFS transporter n=1 Tax=Pseudoflavonifractor phocaeensis TaxID=1870988 RepID=UPI00195D5A4F|nr:MFS transporter [Pseudoflavonifractor phocaeensis]MBM6927147.1 MFS transporter [Pseudoflavonifractor phocaeensis]
MAKQKLHDPGNKNSVVNFGAGWVVIIYCLLMFFLYVGMCNDGANITAPNVANRLGVENGTIMNMNSLAGLVGVVFFIIVGQINRKIGARLTSGICCIVSGIAYMLACNASSVAIYTVAMCFVYGGIMSAGYVAGGTLVATWFPKKKGVVMGYTTMGHNLASAFYVQLVAILIAPMVAGTENIGSNFSSGIIPIGVAAIVLGILGMIFIRNTPQERGLNPDNVSDEVYRNEYDTSDEVEGDGGWTTGKLLATKELWLAAITTGFFQICSVGVMSQLVIRNTQLGFTQQEAMNVMTILALGGVVGSWLIGIIDDKIGTKKTMVGFGIWYAVALLCNFGAADRSSPLVYISLFMIAMGIGGSANFTTSLPASIFGRHGFDKVNSVIFPIQGAVTALCFLVNGAVQLMTGGQIKMAYLVFAGVALVNVLLVLIVNEHRFNRDWKAAHPGK